MTQKNPYEIFGVPSSASAEEIKTAYRNLVRRYHPDKYPTYVQKAWANKKMQEINEAYGVLRDPLRREQYDKRQAVSLSKQKWSQSPTTQPAASGHWFARVFLLAWFVLSLITLPLFSELGVFALFPAIYFGFMALMLIIVGLGMGFYLITMYHKPVGSTPQHPWRDLAVRLALLALVLLSMSYLVYRAGGVSLSSIFGTVLNLFPFSFIPIAWIATILAEIGALFRYIYHARKIAQTTEVLLREQP